MQLGSSVFTETNYNEVAGAGTTRHPGGYQLQLMNLVPPVKSYGNPPY